MSEPQFPPEAQMPYSARKDQFLTCKFLAIRKAVTENPQYKNADGTALMSYNETITDQRDQVRSKVLDYELAKGWLIDDRATAQVITHPAVQQNGANVPTNGVPPAAPVPQQMQIGFQQPQQVASPAQAIAVAQQTAVPTAPPQQLAPPAAMPVGLKRPAPKTLATAVAPPPPPAPVQAPQPPPGAQVIQQNTAPAPTFIPVAPMAPVPMQNVQVSPPTVTVQQDLGPVVAKIDMLGKGLTLISDELERQKNDFKTFVGNLSGQTNETNKALGILSSQLAELKTSVEILTVAVHHIYLTTGTLGQPAGEEGRTIPGFKKYLAKYLPQ